MWSVERKIVITNWLKISLAKNLRNSSQKSSAQAGLFACAISINIRISLDFSNEKPNEEFKKIDSEVMKWHDTWLIIAASKYSLNVEQK